MLYVMHAAVDVVHLLYTYSNSSLINEISNKNNNNIVALFAISDPITLPHTLYNVHAL